jgi:endonuclease YncB( thermonuclease family)
MPDLIALLLMLCCAISQAARITGMVVSVADGDTIMTPANPSIRL